MPPFQKVKVPVPKKSGLFIPWSNSFSAGVGTLTPCCCKEVFPGEKLSLRMSAQISLPPMATDFYGAIEAKFEAFYVPFRLLWGGWKDFITDKADHKYKLGSDWYLFRPTSLPSFTFPYSSLSSPLLPDLFRDNFGSGSLADYLGLYAPLGDASFESDVTIKNILPFVAYHRIYDDWYRNPRLQTPCFAPAGGSGLVGSASSVRIGSLPYISVPISTSSPASSEGPVYSLSFDSSTGTTKLGYEEVSFYDGVSMFSLRQRNFAPDYFTNATYEPQMGDGAAVSLNAQDEFTIASLRAANSLQLFRERNNLAGDRYEDQIFARFGHRPNSVGYRSTYLGQVTLPVYNKSVYQQNLPLESGSIVTKQTNNPFESVGSKYSNPTGAGDGDLFSRVGGEYTADEHGYLFVIFSLVPKRLYGQCMPKMFKRRVLGDFPDPAFIGIGDQELSISEIWGTYVNLATNDADTAFAYTQRYAELKDYPNEVHGNLRDGGSLEAFAIQTTFDERPFLGTDFIQIPTDYLDQVSAVSSAATSNFGCWVDMAFFLRKITPFGDYSLPTLGWPDETYKVEINNGGTSL